MSTFDCERMKSLKIISFLCIILLCPVIIFAGGDKEKEDGPPPWMEDIKVKGRRSTYLIPKGAKREIIGAQVIVESPNEYVARRIYEIERYLEEQFTEIEENQKALKKELEGLKKALSEVKREQKEQEEKTNQKIRFLNNKR